MVRSSVKLIAAIFSFHALTVPASSIADTIFQEGSPALAASTTETVANAVPHFAELARELSKSVVNISVEARGKDMPEGVEGLPPGHPLDRRGPSERPLFSMGSGFIIHPEGYIVTNNHVIERATKVIVRLLNDKSDYVATVIGRDGKTDVALIKITPRKPLPAVFLGDSEVIEVGEWVMAIGNQFQLGQTVTAGIVSALARKVPTRESGPYDSYIQTDASINPGSSGGPLFNSKGQVIGVNTAIFSPGRGGGASAGFNIGIGFAIPVNMIKGIIPQLKEQGKVTRGFLGVIIQPVDQDVASALGLAAPDGALVADVLEGSPASVAKLRRRDVITMFNHRPVRDHDDLPIMVAGMGIGSSVEVEYLRQGVVGKTTVVIQELKEKVAAKLETESAKPNKIGITALPVDERVQKDRKLSAIRGLVVESVEPGSVAQESGLQKGDIVEEIADRPVNSLAELESVIKDLVAGKPVLVLVRREEGTRFLTLKLSESTN
jgi:serine protease Do